MAIIDDADVQVQLPVDKLDIHEVPDDVESAKEDAERIVRGYLAGHIAASVLATWSDPESTPGTIRAIGGRLAAALVYRIRYSEDSLSDPEFAQVKYNEAMKMIEDIIAGTLIIDDVTQSIDFDNTWFEPNDGSTDEPKFTMGARY